MTPTKQELYERAQELDIEGRSEMDKSALEKAVKKAEKKDAAADTDADSPDLEAQQENAEDQGNPAVDDDGENINVTENDGTNETPGIAGAEGTEERENALQPDPDDEDAPLTPGDNEMPIVGATDNVNPEDGPVSGEAATAKVAGVSRGDTVTYIDGRGEEHEVEVVLVDTENDAVKVRVEHELLTVQQGTEPGTFKTASN